MNVGVLTGVVFALAGGVISYFGWRVIGRDRAIKRWPTAPGRIIASSIDEQSGSTRDAHGYDVISTMYQPQARYRYIVDGREYDGSAVQRAASATSRVDHAQEFLNRFAPGAEVQVRYDPKNPATAYLLAGHSTGAIFLAAFGGFFVAIGVLITTLVLALG